MGGKVDNGSASSPYGPVRAGLIPSPGPTKKTARGAVVPSGLLSYSERHQAYLRYKYYTGTAISSIDILYTDATSQEHPVERGGSTYDTGGTDDAA